MHVDLHEFEVDLGVLEKLIQILLDLNRFQISRVIRLSIEQNIASGAIDRHLDFWTALLLQRYLNYSQP